MRPNFFLFSDREYWNRHFDVSYFYILSISGIFHLIYTSYRRFLEPLAKKWLKMTKYFLERLDYIGYMFKKSFKNLKQDRFWHFGLIFKFLLVCSNFYSMINHVDVLRLLFVLFAWIWSCATSSRWSSTACSTLYSLL